MASTYSTNAQLELVATGEKAGQWGGITNTNSFLTAVTVASAVMVRVPIPKVRAFPVRSILALVIMDGLPILMANVLAVKGIVTLPSSATVEKGRSANAANPNNI